MSDHFLGKSQLPLANCLTNGSTLALEQHAALRELLSARLGREGAELFAEPFLSRDKGGQSLTVAWYSAHSGDTSTLSDLDSAQRRQVKDRLLVLVPRVEALVAEFAAQPASSGLIVAALSLASPEDIRIVGGQPVLTGWGVRSRGASSALAPFMRGATQEPATPAAGARSLAEAHPAVAAALPPLQNATLLAGVPVATRLHAMTWVPLVILLALAGLTLLWLLIPGNRVFPVLASTPAGVQDGSVTAAAAEANAALLARRDALLAALSGARCEPDGRVVLPGDFTQDGLPASAPTGGSSTPGQSAQVAPDAPLAPPLDRVTVPDGANSAQTDPLLATIEARTVLVLAQVADGMSAGSGFVVGPGLIVTNHHVIDGALSGKIVVTNHALGHPVVAAILKDVGPLETAGADFALLKIDDTSLPAFALSDPTGTIKLHHVVATGFPGDLMATDASFTALMNGDATAMPDVSVVDGTVNAVQEMMPGTRVLVHSAPLASGNSGGPLVDYCGNVVGVNTFVRTGPMRTLNFALASSDLIAFLRGTPATPKVTTGTCAPTVTPELRPTATSAASDPARSAAGATAAAPKAPEVPTSSAPPAGSN